MRIYVRENKGRKIRLAIPTSMVFNRLTAGAARKCIAKHDQSDNVNISAGDINKLFFELKRFKKKHPDLPLVEVESKDGTRVCIKL